MNKNNLEEYRSKYNIDKILTLLKNKGTKVIDRWSAEMVNVTNSNIDVPVPPGEVCDMRILQIYDSTHDISPGIAEFFKDEITILKSIPNLDRALYVFVSPNTVIPKHCDDDDLCFRIVYGINTPSNNTDTVGLVIEDHAVNIGFGEVVGLKADVDHWGWNNTNEYWSVLTLCVEDKVLDELRKIY